MHRRSTARRATWCVADCMYPWFGYRFVEGEQADVCRPRRCCHSYAGCLVSLTFCSDSLILTVYTSSSIWLKPTLICAHVAVGNGNDVAVNVSSHTGQRANRHARSTLKHRRGILFDPESWNQDHIEKRIHGWNKPLQTQSHSNGQERYRVCITLSCVWFMSSSLSKSAKTGPRPVHDPWRLVRHKYRWRGACHSCTMAIDTVLMSAGRYIPRHSGVANETLDGRNDTPAHVFPQI